MNPASPKSASSLRSSVSLSLRRKSFPGKRLIDIDLFGLVEVSACRHPGLFEPLLLLRRERGRIIRLREGVSLRIPEISISDSVRDVALDSRF